MTFFTMRNPRGLMGCGCYEERARALHSTLACQLHGFAIRVPLLITLLTTPDSTPQPSPLLLSYMLCFSLVPYTLVPII